MKADLPGPALASKSGRYIFQAHPQHTTPAPASTMKGFLVSFLLLGLLVFQMESSSATSATANQRRSDDHHHHEKGTPVDELSFPSPAPPTSITSGPPKYGLCPATSSGLPHPITAYCLEDRRCPGDEKCCRVGNVRKCILPEGVHHGYCPRQEDGAVYKKPCAGDHQCSWHEKCCKTDHHKKCTRAVPAALGLCPKRHLPWVFTPCTNQCKDDRSCPRGRKCCYAECGLKCVTPERHHPAEPQKQGRDQAEGQKAGKDGRGTPPSKESMEVRCHTDRDCPHQKRCCGGVCRRECQPQGRSHADSGQEGLRVALEGAGRKPGGQRGLPLPGKAQQTPDMVSQSWREHRALKRQPLGARIRQCCSGIRFRRARQQRSKREAERGKRSSKGRWGGRDVTTPPELTKMYGKQDKSITTTPEPAELEPEGRAVQAVLDGSRDQGYQEGGGALQERGGGKRQHSLQGEREKRS
ncbi:uncharacterized protein LOC112543174, partial [Python bivittatus]|uniref:Uncharacterized protein LOC112543174 n=1 Tax=Python bivittatus TaxID=176946 RepID=A0A9F5N252_PYTBI